MPSSKSNDNPSTLKCPQCSTVHHAREDEFCNPRQYPDGKKDFDARRVLGITATCPICLDDFSEVYALPCGHILCKDDYQRMGGYVPCTHNSHDGNDEHEESHTDKVLIQIRNAGQSGANGTYRRHCDTKNKYGRMGRYDGLDVEYFIDIRTDSESGRKSWYLSCDTGNPSEPPVDFYKATVNGRCAYPSKVKWEIVTLGLGSFPAPQKCTHSYFGSEC